MLNPPKRRAGLAAVLVAATLTACTPASTTPGPSPSVRPTPAASTTASADATALDASVRRKFDRLQKRYGARLGIYAIDSGTGESVAFRADERFAYASIFKALAAAVVLDTTTTRQLDEVVRYTEDDLIDNSPITTRHLDTGMTWRELCDAAIRYSDNAAGNILLRRVGGPAGLQKALRSIGDHVTSVDRYEPDLASAVPGDVRDTTTPRALAHDLRKFVLGDALTEDDRTLLIDWLRRNTTGDTVVRAGVPDDWVVGDKTGSAYYGGRNDMAVLWPPNDAPIVMAVMTSRSEPRSERVDALVADAATVAITALGRAAPVRPETR